MSVNGCLDNTRERGGAPGDTRRAVQVGTFCATAVGTSPGGNPS